ncbi:MAG: hypothetical protein B6241_13980 [Spirochaetaceae bacterium 4572_59]|nr:MAG: hypothetical protein B6241_13980 [Spirochaetaceae bacterium 4572_59]
MKLHRDLIIFHYHLLPGGVCDVIRHSLKAFSQDPVFRTITVVCGREENTSLILKQMKQLEESSSGIFPQLSLTVLPALDYLRQDKQTDFSVKTLKKMLLDKFGGLESVWLIHNYHLGKNWIFTKALIELGEKNQQNMIFQIHDFPECGRFYNLKTLKDNIAGSLYPRSASIRYCVINKRDYNLLLQAGLDGSTVFLLENPVLKESENSQEKKSDREKLIGKLSGYAPSDGTFYKDGELWLYPVRSIRRKNILEAGLIVKMIEKPVNLVVTLPGISSQEKNYSDITERAFAEGLIPGFWSTGLLAVDSGVSYEEMIRHSDLIFSSSIQEGFGYMYLNAIVWNKPLAARYLDIMEGFLPLFEDYPCHFYDSVRIPGKKSLKESMHNEYMERFSGVQPELPPLLKESLIEELDQFLKQDGVDFSYLTALDQYSVLQSLIKDKGYLRECRELNRKLIVSLQSLSRPEENHRENLYENYGLKSYNKSFHKILNSFTEPPAELLNQKENGATDDFLLKSFTKLEYMRLLYK